MGAWKSHNDVRKDLRDDGCDLPILLRDFSGLLNVRWLGCARGRQMLHLVGRDPHQALAPVLTPKRFLLEHGVSLKFLRLGLMGFTQAPAGPFAEGEQLW